MSTFKSVVTRLGQARIAAALQGADKVDILSLAVGDGNGQSTTPTASQTQLVNEQYRVALNSLKTDNSHTNWLVAEAIIPSSVGGFWLREMGLYSSKGELIAVANLADTYKPTLEEGSGRTLTLRMVITVTDTSAVSVTMDDSLIIATESYVADRLATHEQSRNHPDGTLTDKGFVQLSSTIDSTSEILAATPKAVKTVNDNANARVPATRKINNKALDKDIALTAADVAALDLAGGSVSGKIEIKNGEGLTVSSGDKTAKLSINTTDTRFTNLYSGQSVQLTHDGWLTYGGRKIYHEGYKPGAADVGALAIGGGTLTGDLFVAGSDFVTKRGNYAIDAAKTSYQTNGYRIIGRSTDLFTDIYQWEVVGVYHSLSFHVAGGGADGWYEFRNDGSLRLNGPNALLTVGPANYFSNGDILGSAWGGNLSGWINQQINNLMQDAQNRANNAEANARNDAQNRANNAETNARNWAYANCIQSVQLGARYTQEHISWLWGTPSGCVITGVSGDSDNDTVAQYAPLQIARGGVWATIAG